MIISTHAVLGERTEDFTGNTRAVGHLGIASRA
jgi:hypothetical protein